MWVAWLGILCFYKQTAAYELRISDLISVVCSSDLIVALLQDRPEAYDLMLAADVLSDFGDLRPLFEAAHASLRNDGVFVATVEAGAETGRYVATRTGRYQHGADYLRRRAAEAGFDRDRKSTHLNSSH